MFLVIFVVSPTHIGMCWLKNAEKGICLHALWSWCSGGGSNGHKSILANLLLKCQEWSNICTRVSFV